MFTEKSDKSCKSDQECDGQRTCINSKCAGVARPPKDPFYMFGQYDQNCLPQTPAEVNDYHCTGQKRCTFSGCTGSVALPKSIFYYFDESRTRYNATNQLGCLIKATSPINVQLNLLKDYFCDGLRTFSVSGVCEGTSRPDKTIFYIYDEP